MDDADERAAEDTQSMAQAGAAKDAAAAEHPAEAGPAADATAAAPPLDLTDEDDDADSDPALAELTDDPAALSRLAERYLDQDRPVEALAIYTRLVELTPEDPNPL